MKRRYFIGVDSHCQTCELAVVTATGKLVMRKRCRTTIADIRQLLEEVPKPCQLVVEESPLAGWLYRNLRTFVDTMTVAEPRRNRLIAQGGDKDDPIDAEKLAQLYRGGYIKPVHHTDSLERAVFKQLMMAHYQAGRRRVAEGQRIGALLKQHGVMARARHFATAEDRKGLLTQLPADRTLEQLVQQLWVGYDAAQEQEHTLERQLVRLAQQEEVIRRFEALPGFGWIRSARLYAYLDTPWRFRSPKALWKYLGIGLERRHSGNGPEWLMVPRQVNRLLKSTILGAAKSAIRQGDNVFAEQYGRWIGAGLTPKLAQRNVARSQATTLWGLWKNGTAYDPSQVGGHGAATPVAPGSS